MSKTVLVIGASRGIGKELVHQFAAKDLETFGFARNLQNGSDNKVHSIHLDLLSPTIKSDFEKAISEIDQIDYLIHNAGFIAVKPFLELTREDIHNCYQVNVLSVMEITQICIPKMKSGSHIVMISSIGGFQGSSKFPGLAAYSTSKAALVSLTELLAEEFKNSGISINCLCLGAVQTEMMEEAFPGYKAPHQPAEIAEFIVDFTMNNGKYFHGKIIPVSVSNP
ncbi:SDR family NAD(P)-dependent oxidoreductase [Fluviicola taffensis]|uniref:Short-chain dehydrogenase/reductase SDR n=1 Tax=Fluviicola taffensis (strain DSM 16823 / NCIMB 13979 / RW262) TaxID=755732 RepID=F2ICD2_FLUTR|nr:SDR family oxidoreductase [Fluviicola taffensis]AEA44378.1 short-chain dehydrogenase/reductase SDR [Fluviicola taffensis DSM 16823]